MDIFYNIRQTFRQGNSLIKLIYINVAVFILVNAVILFSTLFKSSSDYIITYLAIPADLISLLHRPWTIVTYMFLHQNFWHILFNMVSLFWFGKIFLMYFSEKQLVGLYIIGGLIAALFYVAAYNLFPLFSDSLQASILLGASGSIMAIILATAIQSPNMELQVLLIGAVKLKYIALVFVLTSFFGITSTNAGGEIAHLGGALAGYLFIVSLHQGKDFTKGLNKILDSVFNIFGPRKLKVKPGKNREKRPMSDAEFNMNKAKKMAEIDKILDKIKTSGYESLSSEEKKRLFEQGNKK